MPRLPTHPKKDSHGGEPDLLPTTYYLLLTFATLPMLLANRAWRLRAVRILSGNLAPAQCFREFTAALVCVPDLAGSVGPPDRPGASRRGAPRPAAARRGPRPDRAGILCAFAFRAVDPEDRMCQKCSTVVKFGGSGSS